MKFVAYAADYEAIRVAPLFDDEQDSVRLGVNSRWRIRARRAGEMWANRNAEQEHDKNGNGSRADKIFVHRAMPSRIHSFGFKGFAQRGFITTRT